MTKNHGRAGDGPPFHPALEFRKRTNAARSVPPEASARPGKTNSADGHTQDAIRIFQLNAATYPSSANTFDALGETYEKDGNRALAISNYEKALQIDPKQVHAADALKRLKN